MNKTQLLPIIKALSRQDFLEFGRYLKNGFFTRDQQVLLLYEYLKKNSKDWSPKKLEKPYVIKKISSKEKQYTVQQLNYVISDLFLQLKNYLVWKQTTQDQTLQNQLLLKSYKDLNLNKQYFQLSKNIEKTLDKRTFRDVDFYQQKMNLYHERYYYPNQLKLNVEKDHLLEAMNHLELYYITSSLRYYIELYTRKKIVKTETPSYVSVDDLLNRLKIAPFNNIPFFQINSLMLQLLLKDNEAAYDALKELIDDKIHDAEPKEQYQIISLLLNYTISKSRAGNSDYAKKRFKLYQFALKDKLLLENGYLNPLHFLNIIDTALALEEFNWITHFINDYQDYLHETFRVNTVNLGLAQFQFAKSEFEETVALLHDVEFKSLSYLVIGKGLLLQSYYELYENGRTDYFQSLDSLIISYDKLLRSRLEESPNVATANLNFLRFAKKLFRNIGQKSISKKSLLEELEEIKPIAYKIWLTKKC